MKLNIGFFSDTFTPQINGVVTSIRIFQKELESLGHNVYIFAPTPYLEEDSPNIFRLPSVPFVFQPEMRLAVPYSWYLKRKIDTLNLDIVHAHTPFSVGIFGRYIAREKRIPFVQTFHTLYPEYLHYILGSLGKNPFVKHGAQKIINLLYNASDLVIAPSLKIKNYLKGCGLKKKIAVIETGIDLKTFQGKNPLLFRKKYKIPQKCFIILFIGRLGKEKNIEFLFRAFRYLEKLPLILILIGDGPEKNTLEKLRKQLGLENRIVFLGYLPREEIPSALAASDIFVFTSKTETQGLAVLEAEASSKPIVALADAVIEEFVKNHYNGFISPASPKIFAQKIKILFKNKALYQKFSENSYKIALKFSSRKQAQKLLKSYHTLLNKK